MTAIIRKARCACGTTEKHLPTTDCEVIWEDVPAPQRWRKKPVVIEAMRTDGTLATARAIAEWAGPSVFPSRHNPKQGTCSEMTVNSLEGPMRVDEGDWVIRGVQGEHYPCKPDIFEATYERENGRSATP